MPFGDEHADPLAADDWTAIFEVIRDVVEEIVPEGSSEPLVCTRADTEPWRGPIMTNVLDGLTTAALVIADLTNRRANVFYELGIRHALGGPTILLTQDDLSLLPGRPNISRNCDRVEQRDP